MVLSTDLFPFIIVINGDFGAVFQPRRASGFEMRKVFQASRNTTCCFLSKTLLPIDLIERA